jgi:16S rRNA (uracil1498-N3)-methyltransferase
LLPYIQHCYSLKRSLECLPPELEGIYLHAGTEHPSLKNYLSEAIAGPRVIALGPERGWTDRELNMMEKWGLKQVQMGERILRTETASIAAASMIIQHLYRY